MTADREKAIKFLGVLVDDLEAVIVVYRTWYCLFRSEDEKERERRFLLMTSFSPAQGFFATIDAVMMNEVIIGLFRLLDEHDKILGLKSLEEFNSLLELAAQQSVTTFVQKAKDVFKPSERMRHNFLAHRNVKLATRTNSEAEASIKLGDIDETFRLVIAVLDLYQTALGLQKIDWNFLFYTDWAGSIEIVLKDAEMFRNLPRPIRRRAELDADGFTDVRVEDL